MNRRLLQLGITLVLGMLAVPVLELFFFSFRIAAFLFLCFWAFPRGLIVVLFGSEKGDTWAALGFAWLAYAIVIVAALWVRNRVAYYILWVLLTLLIVTSVVGCHQDIVDFSNS